MNERAGLPVHLQSVRHFLSKQPELETEQMNNTISAWNQMLMNERSLFETWIDPTDVQDEGDIVWCDVIYVRIILPDVAVEALKLGHDLYQTFCPDDVTWIQTSESGVIWARLWWD